MKVALLQLSDIHIQSDDLMKILLSSIKNLFIVLARL